jgi:peptidoglycan/LPS O-acetylase OafA/YrhL
MTRPALPVLTSLRFFAAAVVVVFHQHRYLPSWFPWYLKAFLQSGYDAVTFFFVLSGFILYYVYANESEQETALANPRRFYVARVARIAPAYYLSLLISAPALIYDAFVSHITPTAVFFCSIVLVPTLLQAWYPQNLAAWNPPSWSLSVEALFYLSFPVVFRAGNRISPYKFFSFSVCALILCEGIRGALRVAMGVDTAMDDGAGRQLESAPAFLLFFPVFHISSFLFGLGLARLHLFGRLPASLNSWLFPCAACGTVLLLCFRTELPSFFLSNITLVPLFGAVILGGARYESGFSKFLSSRPLLLLGEASYAMYILHMPLAFWVGQAEKHLNYAKLLRFHVIYYFLTVVAASVLVFIFIETPLRKSIARRCIG